MTNSDLAHKAMVESIAATQETAQITRLSVPASNPDVVMEVPCDTKDKACTKRWIDSFSDCC